MLAVEEGWLCLVYDRHNALFPSPVGTEGTIPRVFRLVNENLLNPTFSSVCVCACVRRVCLCVCACVRLCVRV